MPDQDPLTQVYTALWGLLEADPAWCGLVKPANRIKFLGPNVSPRKDEAVSADFPEVRIEAAAMTPHLNADSSNSRVTARFEIRVASGQQGYDAALFPVLWQTLRALHGYQAALMALVWRGQPFVKRVQSQEASIGAKDPSLQRGNRWWSAVWVCEVEMWFPMALMQPSA
ncbi:MAG: hypothetical protein ACLQNE_01420 [Thermoguttaceae bacterium]